MALFVRSLPHRLSPGLLAHRRLTVAILGALFFVLGVVAASCGPAAGTDSQHVAQKPARPYDASAVAQNRQAHFPSYVTADMRDGYEYAMAHPEQLQYIPCYCGCGLTAEHKNNLDCYVAGVDANGTAVFDNHASFCSICLEITRDVKRLSAEGKSLKEIRAEVDKVHGEKGPGTDTPMPPS